MKTKITNATVLLFFILLLVSSCSPMKPKSRSLQHKVRMRQQEIQYEHGTAALNDGMRYWRNKWERPYKMTRIPLTQLYIY